MTDSQSADAAQPITQIDFARAGVVTPQMAAVAAAEGREPEDIRAAVATGRIAIPANIHHASLAPAGVGSTLEGVPLSTKVNVNLGISGDLTPSWIFPTPARPAPSAARSLRSRRL